MENKQIKVIVKRPNSKAKEMTIVDKLKTYQELVEGYIEVIPFPKDEKIHFVANEEAKIYGFAPNLCLPHYRDVLCGTIVAVSVDEDGDFQSLTDRQIKKVNHYIDTFNLDNFLFADAKELGEKMLKKMRKYDQEDDLC